MHATKIHDLHTYFHGVKPGTLEGVIRRLVAESPEVEFKLSASPVITGKDVKYFIVTVACEEPISTDVADRFHSLQLALKRDGLINW